MESGCRRIEKVTKLLLFVAIRNSENENGSQNENGERIGVSPHF